MKVAARYTAFFSLCLLSACASLPLPDAPEKSLLVIPCDIGRNTVATGPNTVGIMATIVRSSDSKELTVSFPLKNGYSAIALDPGAYRIAQVTISRRWYHDGQPQSYWEDTYKNLGVFYVEAQTLLLSQYLLSYADTDNSQKYRFSVAERSYEDAHAGPILDALKKDRHWQAWEGYQLVGFSSELPFTDGWSAALA